MAEIKPIPFREVQPRVSSRGGSVGIAEGAADVLGTLTGYANKRVLSSYADHLETTISQLDTEESGEELLGEVSASPAVMRFMERVQKLENVVNTGQTNQVANARLMAKRELAKAVSQFPHLRAEFLQVTSNILNTNAELENMALEDSFNQQEFQRSANELDYLERRGHQMGVPAYLEVGTEEWGDLYVKLDHAFSRAKIAELDLEAKAADQATKATEIEQALYETLSGPESYYSLKTNAILVQLEEFKKVSRKASQGVSLSGGEFDLNAEMIGGLKSQLVQDAMELVMDYTDVVPTTFGAKHMGTPNAKRAQEYVNARIQWTKDLISAIERDDTNALSAIEMREKSLARMITQDNSDYANAQVGIQMLGGPENLRILSEIKGFENIELLDKLGRGLAGGVNQAMDTMASTIADGMPDPTDLRGSSYTERVERNLTPKGNRNSLKHRVRELSEGFSNAGVLLYTDIDTLPEHTLNALTGNVGVMLQDRYNTEDTYNAVANTLNDEDFIERIDQLRGNPKMHKALGNLGLKLQDYLLSVIYPEEGYDARNSQYYKLLDTPIGTAGPSSTTYLKLRDVIKLDQGVLLQDKKIKFYLNDAVLSNVQAKNEVGRRQINDAIYDLNRQLNKDVNLYYQTEKMLRPDEDIQIEALLYRMGFAEVLFGNTDQ